MDSSFIPGIKKIGYVDRRNLQPNIQVKSLAGITIGIFSDYTEIPIFGNSTCVTTSEPDYSVQIEKTVLKFSSTWKISLNLWNIAFIIFGANGKSYLLGTKEYPYPTIKWEKSSAIPSGESSAYQYEITLTAKKSIIEVVI